MKAYKLVPIFALAAVLYSTETNAQFKLGDALKKAAGSAANGALNPSTADIAAGLREALTKGVSAGSDRLSLQDGFMGNAAVKLLFPPEARKIEKTLRGMGMNKLCDDFVMSMNRAAEDAAKQAKPIFITAIKEMGIKDASNILLSDQKDAATTYFKSVTTDQLKTAFSPVIKSSLDKAGATKYWEEVTTAYNKVPLVKKIDSDLVGYATQKSVDGLFYEVAQEELKIRSNSSVRDTPLLKKVFGYADGNRVSIAN